MKRLFIIFTIAILGISTYAQRETSLVSEYSLTTDTLTNTGTIYMTVPKEITGNYVASFSTTATNISGTTAGTAWLQQSVNGSGYDNWSITDTFAITTATTKVWIIDYSPCKKYRVKYTGTGTQSTSIVGSYVTKDIKD